MWILAVVSILAVTVGAAVTLVRMHSVQEDHSRALRTLVPGANALSRAATTADSATTYFSQIVNATDRSDLVNMLATYSTAATEASGAWNNYLTLPVRFPKEAALRVQFADLVTRRNKLMTEILLTAPGQAMAEISAADGLSSVQARDLATLRNLYESAIHRAVQTASENTNGVATASWIAGGAVLALLFGMFGTVIQLARVRERAGRAEARELAARARRDELEARLQRALELARSEEDTYPRIDQALREAVPEHPAEVLLADSSRAHVRAVVHTGDAERRGCSVGAPTDCPAASRGQTQLFESSRALDACAYLRDDWPEGASATCTPVSVAGKTVGVLHAGGPDQQVHDRDVVATLELVARKAGERIGMLRAFARSETQARTDQLSGLLNRRSLEVRVTELVTENRPYSVVFADLDHFKQLNDVHGHEAGDRALRLFARTLRDSVRPADIPARYGGEEFVIVLPECAPADTLGVVERIRSRLAGALESGTVPAFTASFGVAASEGNWTFSETLEMADQALLEAKRLGRDQIVVSGDRPDSPDEAADAA